MPAVVPAVVLAVAPAVVPAVAAVSAAGYAAAAAEVAAHMAYAPAVLVASLGLLRALVHVGEIVIVVDWVADTSGRLALAIEAVASVLLTDVRSAIFEAADPQARH